LSYDEKTQVQALDRTQPLLPIDFGLTEKRTHWDDSCSAPEPGSDPRSHRLGAQ
jgi:hypothetical protein